MKQIYLSLFLLVGLFSFWQPQLEAQPSLSVLEKITEAITKGESAGLMPYCQDQLEVTLSGQRQVYAMRQAQYVLTDFFNSHPPLAFSVKHKGDTATTLYALGEYRTGREVYDVYLFLRLVGDSYRLDEIRFERQ